MSKIRNTGILQRAADYFQLVRRLVDSGHDLEALEMAKTILDRGNRQFPFDAALDQRGAAISTPEEFCRVHDLLKWIEGPDGAALDGGGPEPDLVHAGRRFGSVGMPARREALINASTDIEYARSWQSAIRTVFSGPDAEWRWRDAGWFHGLAFGDVAALLFQPVVILVAPGRGVLEHAASVLEQLFPPVPPIPVSLARAGEKTLRVPCAAMALLDTSAPNPPGVVQFLQSLIQCRRECARAGWNASDVEIVVLGGDPVWTCLTEWIRRGKTSQAFSAAWESASRGEGELADIYRAATTVAPVAEVVRQLSGEEHALFSNAESRPFIEEKGASIRLTLCREENMHLLVERLRRNAGETEVEARTMDRVRHIDRAKLVAHHCEGVGGIEISSSSVSPACGAEWPSMVFSGQDRQALVAKWSVRPNGDDSLVYVFPHIPKTAGSSVHYHLKTNMAYDSEYIHIPIDNTTNEELRMRTPFTLRDERDRVRAKILFGHGVIRRHAEFVPGKRVREIVTLRDPVERTLSHYNFWMNVLEKRGDQPMDFDQWYAGEPRNYHVNWIAKNYLEVGDDLSPADAFSTAKEALENFWMVCTLPTFERDIQRLWAALDLPPMQLRQNVGGVTHEKRLECDDALRQRLIEENSFDHELYLLWVERNRAADIPTLQPA